MRGWLRMVSLLAGAGVCGVAPGCSTQGRQWSLELGTSAELPRMGDRLFVEVLDVDGRPACADCTREFDLHYAANTLSLESGGLTMGVAETASVVRVHARLFKYSTSASGTASPQSAIDVVARLPPLTNTYEYKLVPFPLPVSCLGRPPDLAAGTTCQLGPDNTVIEGPEPTLPERDAHTGFSIPKDANVPLGCTRPVREGMACVGAGAFLLGDERYEGLAFDYPARPEVGIFFSAKSALMLDIDEMTVGTVRRLVKSGTVVAADAIVKKSALKDTLEEACTYLGPDDASNDALPLNCVGRDVAAAVCKALGRRLPTESEWEFAATNGVEETIYPWGNYEDDLEGVSIYDENAVVCKKAMIGRGRKALGESTACETKAGPVAGGSALDVSKAGVKNLGGNLSEWVSGELGFYDEPCWHSGTGCLVPSPRLERRMVPHRGASWARDPAAAVAIARFARPEGQPSPYVGFRCAITENELP